MATSTTARAEPRQAALDEFGVHDYELGDLLREHNGKLSLTECPICATDPTRPRYHFRRQESRPAHFADVHGVQR